MCVPPCTHMQACTPTCPHMNLRAPTRVHRWAHVCVCACMGLCACPRMAVYMWNVCVHAWACICTCGAVPTCTCVHAHVWGMLCGFWPGEGCPVKGVQEGTQASSTFQFCPPGPGSLAEVWALELASPDAHGDIPDLVPLAGSRWPGLLVNRLKRHLGGPRAGGLGRACWGSLCWWQRVGLILWPQVLPPTPKTRSRARGRPGRFTGSPILFLVR